MKEVDKKSSPGESNKILWMAAKVLGFFVFKILFQLEIKGKENIPRHGNFIIASNHTSFLDPPLIGYICNKPISYFTKQEQLVGLFGLLITKLGAIPISKTNVGRSDIRCAIDIIKRGKSMLIFPEGTRSRTGKILPGKPGIGLIATRTKVPVIPVYIKGSFKALPPYRHFIRPGKIIINIGRPCFFPENQPYQEIADQIMQKISELSE